MTTERIDIIVSERGSQAVNRKISAIGTSATKAQGGVKLLGTALGAIGGAAIIGGLSKAVGIFARFEQEMATVSAVTGATKSEFKALNEEAQRLGISTRFSATEAAEGMTFLARAGFDTNAVLDSVGATLTLAQAGALGLGEAADIASNVLTGFRLEAKEAGRVVDILAKAANSSNTTVGQLGEAMKFVAPVAAGVGQEIELTTAAVGALSDAGLQASMAGTGLRRVLATLEAPNQAQAKALAALGIRYDEVKVSQIGLVAAMKKLKAAGVDTGAAMRIFGQRGGPAFEVMSSNIPKIEELAAKLKEAGGTAAEVANIMDDTLQGSLFAVKSAFEGFILSIGESGATDAFADAFRGLAELIRNENLIAFARAAGKELGELFTTTGQVINALVKAVSVTSEFADKLGILEPSLSAIGNVFDVLLNPIDAVLRLVDRLTEAFNNMVTAVTNAANALKNQLSSALNSVKNIGSGIAGSVSGAASSIGNFLGLTSPTDTLNSGSGSDELGGSQGSDLLGGFGSLGSIDSFFPDTSNFSSGLREINTELNTLKSNLTTAKVGVTSLSDTAISSSPIVEDGYTRQATALQNVASSADETTASLQQASQFGQQFGSILGSSLKSLIDGSKSLKEVLADLASRLAELALQAAFSGIGGQGGGIFGSLLGGLFAKGGVFKGGSLQAFAKGGVVNSPQVFPFARGGSGALGLMGEAGPEAILPLSRMNNGSLGVAAQGGGGNRTVVNSITVNVEGGSKGDKDADESFAKRIGEEVRDAVNQLVDERMLTNNSYGGAFNPRGVT